MVEGFAGRCFCGEISYHVTVAPGLFVACHCRDCRYASGGAPANVLVVPIDKLVFDTGEATLGEFACLADAGRKVTRQFCKTCGTPMFERLEMLEPTLMLVKAGTVDDQSALTLEGTVWASSAPSWAEVDPRVPAFPDNPPPEFVQEAFAAKGQS